MVEFDLPLELVDEINRAAVACARKAADEWTERTPDKPRFVAGSIRPDDQADRRSAPRSTIRPIATRPSTRWATAIGPKSSRLVDAGVDILLPETAIDTLNLKACLFAIQDFFDAGRSPRAGDGQRHVRRGRPHVCQRPKVEAFWTALCHFPLLVDRNELRLGPRRDAAAHRRIVARRPVIPISCHPNAGLPNDMGQFDLGPEAMADIVGEFADNGWVNILGGCCGTTPDHIRAIADACRGTQAQARIGRPGLHAAVRSAADGHAARRFHSRWSASGPTSPAAASSPG